MMETTSPKGVLGLYSFNQQVGNTPPDIKPIGIQKWTGDHSACLNPAFKSFFENPKLSFNRKKWQENTFLALGVGPGRWTGSRVGVSFAKSLNFISHVPLYPVSSLKILAQSQFEQEKPVLVLMNAFKNSLYMALYKRKKDRLQELIAPSVTLPQDLVHIIKEECVCVGDGYQAYSAYLPESLKVKLKPVTPTFPEIQGLVSLLKQEFDPKHFIGWRDLEPFYLRSPVTTLYKQELPVQHTNK